MSYPVVNMVSKRFGRWTVLRRIRVLREHRPHYLCKCVCGEEAVVDGSNLRSGDSQSCGCLKRELAGKQRYGHRHGDTQLIDGKVLATKEYRAWCNMKTRCYNKKHYKYRDYGGRSIRVCSRWLGKNGYVNFLADMGRAPSPQHSIDRKNNNGNYTPKNCRWATVKQQLANRRQRAQ